MGDIAEMMLDGTLCEGCGVYLEGEAPGYPRYCSRQCRSDRQHPDDRNAKAANIAAHEQRQGEKKKIPCPLCKKKVRTVGLPNHIKDAHPGEPA